MFVQMTDSSAINATPISDGLGKAGLYLISFAQPGELEDGCFALSTAEMGEVTSGIH